MKKLYVFFCFTILSCNYDCKTRVLEQMASHFKGNDYVLVQQSCTNHDAYAFFRIRDSFIIKNRSLFIDSASARELLAGKIENTYFSVRLNRAYFLKWQPHTSMYAYDMIELDTLSKTARFFSNFGE